MTSIALWNFDDSGTAVDSVVTDGVATNGAYHHGAHASGGQAVFDGCNDYIKVPANDGFQLDSGQIVTEFTPDHVPTGSHEEAIISRDSSGYDDGGHFGLWICPNGVVMVRHQTETESEYFTTPTGFYSAGDTLKVTYSWDFEGEGGVYKVENLTTSDVYEEDVPNTLTMDMGDDYNEPWTFGASQMYSGDNQANNLHDYFDGKIDYVSINDDPNGGDSGSPTIQSQGGIVDGTDGADLIDLNYTDDPEGDRIDNSDNIFAGRGPEDDIVLAGDGADTVEANNGNDIVFGGAGSDYIDGGNGNDILFGGDAVAPTTVITSLGQDVTLDFEDLDRGDIVTNQYASQGVQITTSSGYHPAMIFDSDNPTGGDWDLASDTQGNILILSEDRDSNDPDDYYCGGTFTFTFDDPVAMQSITFLDIEENGTYVRLYDANGDLIESQPVATTANGGIQTHTINVENVASMEVVLRGSGAIDDVSYVLPFPDDAALEALAVGDEDDEIYGGNGEDILLGGGGNDTLSGGNHADRIFGGDDADTILGGDAGDVVDGGEGGDDNDTLDLTGVGPVNVTYDPLNSENGTVDFLNGAGDVTGSMEFSNIENVIVCFTPGTMIATPRGERPVESLKVGDKVITRDNGIQEIRWRGERSLNGMELAQQPHLRPVMVKAGSLGNGLPERDMTLSPNHRVLVSNDRTALYFEEREVLVAAKHLVNNKDVAQIKSAGTTYIHFMFENHEVVLSNGAWTESFQPGDYSLKGIGNSQRSEIFSLFPELETAEGIDAYQSARKILKKHEARLLIN